MKKGSRGKVKKIVVNSLEELEYERCKQRLDGLKKKFDATIKHMDEVEKIHEDYYQTRKQLTQPMRPRQDEKEKKPRS